MEQDAKKALKDFSFSFFARIVWLDIDISPSYLMMFDLKESLFLSGRVIVGC